MLLMVLERNGSNVFSSWHRLEFWALAFARSWAYGRLIPSSESLDHMLDEDDVVDKQVVVDVPTAAGDTAGRVGVDAGVTVEVGVGVPAGAEASVDRDSPTAPHTEVEPLLDADADAVPGWSPFTSLVGRITSVPLSAEATGTGALPTTGPPRPGGPGATAAFSRTAPAAVGGTGVDAGRGGGGGSGGGAGVCTDAGGSAGDGTRTGPGIEACAWAGGGVGTGTAPAPAANKDAPGVVERLVEDLLSHGEPEPTRCQPSLYLTA